MCGCTSKIFKQTFCSHPMCPYRSYKKLTEFVHWETNLKSSNSIMCLENCWLETILDSLSYTLSRKSCIYVLWLKCSLSTV